MKRHLWIVVALALCGVILAVSAAQSSATATVKPAQAAKVPPGVEAAQTLSMITGVAISPLLGVSAVGAWQYWHGTPETRPKLPWFAQPWFWIPGLLIVGLCGLKDVLGPTTPTILKKPIDAAETVEHKISGLVAAGAFVPLVASLFPEAVQQSASLSAMGFATADFSWLLNILTVPLGIAIFAVVWLCSNAINVLILISPFATVDAALKGARTLLLGTVVGTSFYDPYLGAAWALIIICIAYFLSGWSFRLMVFGLVFVWDTLTFRRRRFAVSREGNRMFTARAIDKTPVRTYGTLVRDDKGRLVFHYRPWLVLRKQELILTDGVYAVGRGLIYPELMELNGNDSKTIMLLPPRCQTHEDELTQSYGFAAVQDIGLLMGLKAVWRWAKSLFGFRIKSAAPG